MKALAALLLALSALWGLVAPREPAPLGGPVDSIVIDKSDRTLALMEDGVAVRTYAVALGFAPEGAKARQGDGRTPEGVFAVDRRNDASRFHLSLGLEYLYTSVKDDDFDVRVGQGNAPATSPFLTGSPNGTDVRRSEDDFKVGSLRLTAAYRF